ncbi:MAG: META domain-containing protein [Treponema sp.]|jgi:heat shock protein HslJ|nr:META domain-containing protein [Treponema sp.]
MKRYAILAVLLSAVVLMAVACAGAPKFSDIQNKDWKLVEVWNKSTAHPEDIHFERIKLTKEGFSEIFTLRFDSDIADGMARINGVGAPNHFFAPYTLEDKQGISIKPIAQTLMAPLHEPEKLKEHEYLMYLQNTTTWNIVKGNLVLHSQSESGAEVIMTFVLAK